MTESTRKKHFFQQLFEGVVEYIREGKTLLYGKESSGKIIIKKWYQVK